MPHQLMFLLILPLCLTVVQGMWSGQPRVMSLVPASGAPADAAVMPGMSAMPGAAVRPMMMPNDGTLPYMQPGELSVWWRQVNTSPACAVAAAT
jgi:hypothetical protein